MVMLITCKRYPYYFKEVRDPLCGEVRQLVLIRSRLRAIFTFYRLKGARFLIIFFLYLSKNRLDYCSALGGSGALWH